MSFQAWWSTALQYFNSNNISNIWKDRRRRMQREREKKTHTNNHLNRFILSVKLAAKYVLCAKRWTRTRTTIEHIYSKHPTKTIQRFGGKRMEKGVTRCLKTLEIHSTVYWSSVCCNIPSNLHTLFYVWIYKQ